MVLEIIFWILLILWGVLGFIPAQPWATRGSPIILIILLAILGYFVFGNPVHK